MLALAVKAGLPLISVETDDVVNVSSVLSEIVEHPVTEVKLDPKANPMFMHKVSYAICSKEHQYNWLPMYKDLAAKQRTLVVVNPREQNDLVFNAGYLPLPKNILQSFLNEIVEADKIDEVGKVLAGLSLKAVSDVCMLSMAEFGELTPRGVVNTRRRVCSNVRGLEQVDTAYQVYVPNDEIEKWIYREGKIFLAGGPQILMPRGLLLAGAPGVGKSLAAKYICNQLQVPLYRMDVSGILGKYVGDSESRMTIMLNRIEQVSPCVLLIDEVEKLFKAKEDGGVTQRLLSSLLWWLQEHRKPVVVIMTTNDDAALPQELVRPGRLDKKVQVEGISGGDDLKYFAEVVYDNLSKGLKTHKNKCLSTVSKRMVKPEYSQAEVTQFVIDALKDDVLAFTNLPTCL